MLFEVRKGAGNHCAFVLARCGIGIRRYLGWDE